MVFGIGAIVDNFLDGLGDVFLHLERLAQSGERIVPFVFAVDGFLYGRNCNRWFDNDRVRHRRHSIENGDSHCDMSQSNFKVIIYQRRWQDVQIVVSAHTQVAQQLESVLALFRRAVEKEIRQTRTLDRIMVGPRSLFKK